MKSNRLNISLIKILSIVKYLLKLVLNIIKLVIFNIMKTLIFTNTLKFNRLNMLKVQSQRNPSIYVLTQLTL